MPAKKGKIYPAKLKNPGGRPKGRLNNATLEKMAVQRAVHQKILRKAERLHNAQYTLAVGSVSIFRIDINPNTGKQQHTLVTDDQEVSELLDTLQGANEAEIGPCQYVVVTYNAPDNKAIDSMFDRVFGKPATVVEIEQAKEHKQHAARLFAMLLMAMQDSSLSPKEQVAKAVQGYCRIKGLDPAEMATLVQSEVQQIAGEM